MIRLVYRRKRVKGDIAMQEDNLSRLEKWRSKYGALAIAVSCLISLLSRWGDHWLLTIILGLGVLICGWIGIGDLKRAKRNR